LTTGGQVDGGAIDKAVDIIRDRVNGLGVSEAEVKKAGSQIEISVPGRGRNDVVELVGQTAELRFREVYTSADSAAPGAPTAPAPPAPTAPAAPVPASPAPGAPTAPAPTASAPAPSGASGEPAATRTSRPRVADSGLLAVGAPPAATGTPSTAVTPSPAPEAPPTSAPQVPPAAGGADTPPQKVLEEFERLTCPLPAGHAPATGTDAAGDWTVACHREGDADSRSTKYLLKPATVVGTDVKTATAGLDSAPGVTTNVTTGQWEVSVEFTGSGQEKFTKLTEKTVGRQVAIVLDGVVQSAPQIQDRIPGAARISGKFTQAEAQDLANVLRYGALPLAFENSSAQSISPTLGRDSLNGGLLAGAIGLALVIIYAFVYYRAMGLVVISSLAVSAMLVYASVVLLGQVIGFTLTLAGIAGLIVSIGITADSFVVYFERIKDEVRQGRSVRAAVDRAWPSARRTMLSADTVSFLAAAVLYVLSVGSVRGFAFTLGLSTIIDILIMFIFTRPLVTLLVKRRLFATSRFSGLTLDAVGAAGARRQVPAPALRERSSRPAAQKRGN
jgi:preprotein translocase subunit SecD